MLLYTTKSKMYTVVTIKWCEIGWKYASCMLSANLYIDTLLDQLLCYIHDSNYANMKAS
jgi:hypothetical protein